MKFSEGVCSRGKKKKKSEVAKQTFGWEVIEDAGYMLKIWVVPNCMKSLSVRMDR